MFVMILSSFKQKVRNIDQEFYVSIELLFWGYRYLFLFSPSLLLSWLLISM